MRSTGRHDHEVNITVLAKAHAKNPSIMQIDETHFRVAVKEPARDGKANKAIQKALAAFFKIPQSSVRLTIGSTSKQKIFTLDL